MLVRPIRFTGHLPAFRELLTALGGTPIVEEDGWLVFDLESGRGVRAAAIDESYSRALLIPDPDGGADLWVNQRQRDLYGYTAAPRATAELPG